jgi:hypothetical protein
MWSTHSRRIDPISHAVNAVPVPDHVALRLVPGECLRCLTRDSFGGWMSGDVDPDELSAVYPNDDECIEEVETDRRDNKQVHGSNIWRMITQERSPSLTGWYPPFDHVVGDARLRDLSAELEQFAVDARRAPKRVFDAYPPDQEAQPRLDLRSPSPRARLPTPITAKSGSVPPQERLEPNDGENPQDCWKPAIQLNKEPAIVVREPNATTRPAHQDNQRMSKHRVLGFKP